MQKAEGSAFRNILVWQRSMDLAREVYSITKQLPKEEQFSLISQARRCAISIPSNIAEGAKRGSKKDFARFLCISAGSAAELETQMLLMQDLYDTVDCASALGLLVEV